MMRLPALSTMAACLSAVLLGSNVCLGQASESVELSWVAPENCPQQSQVQHQLQALFGNSSSDTQSPLIARGSITSVDGHYRLTLYIERRAAHGVRLIESDDCQSLGNAAAVVLGLLVEKERALGRELSETEISNNPEQARPPDNPPKPELAPEAAKLVVLQPVTQVERPWHLLLRAPVGSVNYLALPQVGWGVGLGIGVSYNKWRVVAAGTFFQAQEQLATAHPYRVEYRRKTLELVGCHGWRSGAFELAPCGVVTADNVNVHASMKDALAGANDSFTATDRKSYWLSLGGGISGFLYLQRHVALLVSGAGRITTNQVRFAVGTATGVDQAHRVPLGTLDAAIACEWIF